MLCLFGVGIEGYEDRVSLLMKCMWVVVEGVFVCV